MFKSFAGFGSAAIIALGIVFAGSTPGDAQSVMKQCGDQWQAAKAAGTTNGQTWPQFLSQCRTQLKAGTAAPAPAQAAPPAPPSPSTAQVPMAGKTTAQCDAEYAANKAAIRASGQTKRAFVAACRAGNETIPQGAAAAPAPAPMPAPSAAPAPAPMAPAPPVTPTGAGQFASEQQAKYRCPSDTVVWVNTSSHVYHFAGTRNYGTTHHGAYMCEADAKAAGDRAAENERHP
jgi:hypothetical protein